MDERDAERCADAADERVPRLLRPALQVERDDAAVGAMLLDLPSVADGDREVVAPVLARSRDQCAHMRLRAAAMIVDHVEDATAGLGIDRETHRGRFAQRP
jgi:hypothetical protein